MNVNFWTLLVPSLTRATRAIDATNLSGIIGFSHQCGLGQRCPQWTSSPKPCSLWPAAPAWQVPDYAPHLPVDSCLQVALRVPAVTCKSFFSSPWFFVFCLLFGNLLLIQHMEQGGPSLEFRPMGSLFLCLSLTLPHSISIFAHLSEQNESEL